MHACRFSWHQTWIYLLLRLQAMLVYVRCDVMLSYVWCHVLLVYAWPPSARPLPLSERWTRRWAGVSGTGTTGAPSCWWTTVSAGHAAWTASPSGCGASCDTRVTGLRWPTGWDSSPPICSAGRRRGGRSRGGSDKRGSEWSGVEGGEGWLGRRGRVSFFKLLVGKSQLLDKILSS